MKYKVHYIIVQYNERAHRKEKTINIDADCTQNARHTFFTTLKDKELRMAKRIMITKIEVK